MEHVEQIHTNERVPGHPNYYEKDGLRTYGDGEDHDHEPPMTFKRIMSLIAMAFCEFCTLKLPSGTGLTIAQCGLEVRYPYIYSVVSLHISTATLAALIDGSGLCSRTFSH